MAKARFTPEQVAYIRAALKNNQELAQEFNTSEVTISKVRNFRGAYKQTVLDLGTPVLDMHGNVVGVNPSGA